MKWQQYNNNNNNLVARQGLKVQKFAIRFGNDEEVWQLFASVIRKDALDNKEENAGWILKK